VEQGNAGIAIAFAPVPAPAFAMLADWTLEQRLGYLRSWSAVAICRRRMGADPVAACAPALAQAWGEEPVRAVRFALALRAARVE
jgi:hypothetical protein